MSSVNDFDSVGAFHRKFNLPNHIAVPRHLSNEERDFRVGFIEEELRELKEGYASNDLEKIADALVDLVYVALGTAHFHGLPWPELFAEVQQANMSKERSLGDYDDRSARGTKWDVVKPKGWTPPDIGGILRKFGYRKKD